MILLKLSIENIIHQLSEVVESEYHSDLCNLLENIDLIESCQYVPKFNVYVDDALDVVIRFSHGKFVFRMMDSYI